MSDMETTSMVDREPHEGIKGEDRDDWLLAVDAKAFLHRHVIIELARQLFSATLGGDPPPSTEQLFAHMTSEPLPGELVVVMERPFHFETLGMFIERRVEYSCLPEDWEGDPSERTTTTATYLQYGNRPIDVVRWVNADVIRLPPTVQSWIEEKPER